MIFLSKLSGNSQTKLEHFEEKLEVSFTANWRLKIILNYNINLENWTFASNDCYLPWTKLIFVRNNGKKMDI